MNNELPIRKHLRLKEYDYSSAGGYFLTICVEDMRKLLGEVVGRDDPGAPNIELSKYGTIVEKHLFAINSHYKDLEIEKYVIMPNHVHILISMYSVQTNGASRTPPPTRANERIPRFVSTFKRFVHKNCGFKMFQRDYHEHIIRDEADYLQYWQYIDNNPAKWAEDKYYKKEG